MKQTSRKIGRRVTMYYEPFGTDLVLMITKVTRSTLTGVVVDSETPLGKLLLGYEYEVQRKGQRIF